jgi:hypothetical protein
MCGTRYLCTRKSGTAPLWCSEMQKFFGFLEETKDENSSTQVEENTR